MKPNARTDNAAAEQTGDLFRLTSGGLVVEGNLREGSYRYEWNGGGAIAGACSEFAANGANYVSSQAAGHVLKAVHDIEDDFGAGKEAEVEHVFSSGIVLVNTFRVYADLPFFLLRSVIRHSETLRGNRIAPVVADKRRGGSISQPAEESLLSLFVPFDNDKWVRYASQPLEKAHESYEVGALFAPGRKNGFVIGSLTHDMWKSAVAFTGAGRHADGIVAYAGAAGELTRDSLPHGEIHGESIASPWMLVGYFNDVARGLETYADANTKLAPALPWENGVPFGWNSWSAVGSKVDRPVYAAASDFIKERLQPFGFHNNGDVHINFDASWSRLAEGELEQAVRHARNNGHKAGIYWTPFAFWGDDTARFVEGTDGQYRYVDLLLKDDAGNALPDLDGGLAIDPTHPGTLRRIDWQVERFHQLDFDYIKLDFMGHAALEGCHADTRIRTGMQAYSYGMEYLCKALSASPSGKRMFLNLSIAPLFPYAYAHSRRISCDAFAKIKDTEYMLNALTYGWWIHDRLYAFNDPDHTVLYKSFNQEPTTEAEARSRYHASVIAGTVMLLGDDFRIPEAVERAAAVGSNEAINAIAREGRTFKPLSLDVGDGACDVFTRQNEAGRPEYVAVFNYSGERAVKRIALSALGLDAEAATVAFTDLRSGERHAAGPRAEEAQGSNQEETHGSGQEAELTLTLEAADSVILQVSQALEERE